MNARRLFETRCLRPVLAGLAITLLTLVPVGAAQQDWEMRVCAPPFDYPMSSRDEGGFNNRIGEVLAEELGARLSFEWVRLDRQSLQRTLLSGACDVVIGIAEGTSNVLSTVPYLRAPFVFVTRENANIEIESINDPILRELRIGTYQQGIPEHVLDSLGITANVTGYPPVGTPGGSNLELAALDALAEGEIDVAILYAPRAVAYDAANEEVDFEIEPVTPGVIAAETLIIMSRTWTIGVRPGDEAFRDRLNVALAERWEDVQQAISDFGIPQIQIPRPLRGAARVESGTSIGVVVPGRTGGMVDQVVAGESARRGALLAEVFLGRGDFDGIEAKVLHANAPTDPAAVRAAERLIATEDVAALVAGFGHEQSLELSEIAEESDVLFFNVASTATDLRQQCTGYTFHVEASAAMLADAAINWYADEQGVDSWYLVHLDTPSGEALRNHLEGTLANAESGKLAGSSTTRPGQFIYVDTIEKALASGADAVLLALAPGEQELFLSQYPQEEGPQVVLVPGTEAQTRDFLRRFNDVSPRGAALRPVTWDPALTDGAAHLNETFLSRNAAPMEPVGWTTYAAVMIFQEAINAVEERSADALSRYLTSQESSFELGKGVGLSFRPWSHQLRQPIYMVRPDPEAEWGIEPQVQVEFAEIVGRWPKGSDPRTLDTLGISEQESACTEAMQ